MSGVIEGGWDYVWAAYGITALVFAIYIVSVVSRFRTSVRPEDRR